MRELYLDIETYSDVDLKRLGVYPYSASPNFKILMMGWAFDDDPVEAAVGTVEIFDALGDALEDPGILKIAHNAQFERVCFSRWSGLAHDQFLPVEEWHDTAAVAAQRGYPRHLGSLGVALGGEKKDEAGTRLINLFCVPQRVFNYERAYLPEEKPEEWKQFIDYCVQDVVTHRDVHRRLGGFPTERERQVFFMDQRLNDRGIKIDRHLAELAEAETEVNLQRDGEELVQITGANTPNSIAQIKTWLGEHGAIIPDMKAETIDAALKTAKGMDPQARRVLHLRKSLALTAVKKFGVALGAAGKDDRLRGQFLYHGAHTGRWSGRGVQLHNLPRDQFVKNENGKKVHDEAAEQAAILDLMLGLGATTDTMKKLVRSMLIGPFSVVDYSAIEARVIAWLAGEEWSLEAFRQGRDIYVETAKMMTAALNRSVPFERKDGKVAVLALGFQGAINSLRVMGAEGTDEELLALVQGFRTANSKIVDLWYLMGEAFMKGGKVGKFVRVEADGSDRRVVLPSGRAIEYHGYKTVWVETAYGRKPGASFIDPQKGVRVRTYGGRLTENVVQGTARDVMADALVRLDERGLRPVGHVHDEILVESEELELVKKLMTEVPDWAPGLPLAGEGFTTYRYMKG